MPSFLLGFFDFLPIIESWKMKRWKWQRCMEPCSRPRSLPPSHPPPPPPNTSLVPASDAVGESLRVSGVLSCWNLLQSGFVRRSLSAALWNAKPEIPPSFAHLVVVVGGEGLAQDSCKKDAFWPPSCGRPMPGSWWIRRSIGSHIFWISPGVLSLWQTLKSAPSGPWPDFYFSVSFKLLFTEVQAVINEHGMHTLLPPLRTVKVFFIDFLQWCNWFLTFKSYLHLNSFSTVKI